MTSYQSIQTLYPQSLLAQSAQRQLNGCLQILSGSVIWLIYLTKGKLVYATNSVSPWERLARHLGDLSDRSPALLSAFTQLRARATSATGDIPYADYQAICWLVQQNYLNRTQAATVIEEIAKEVLQSLFSVREGTYKMVDPGALNQLPKFCLLDIPLLVNRFSTQLQPVQTLEASSGFSSQSDRQSTSTCEPDKKVYTIACIDDNQSVLQAIRNFLEGEDFAVAIVDNPLKALMQLMRCKPDLILLDVTMPNLDGYELCSLLRRHSSFKDTPIIMVTGNTGFIDRAKAKLVKSSDYLTKPFTKSDLLKMVRKYVQ
jgi:two-component system, chemotaxis family, response regulator PixG